ncbi:solute:sodium symporter family transporter [Intestinibacillus massiliensis]|uniref:solute:sodium symporter family transporter n=1 Tax=Intestinibacillus massiliensis TaxID=1871029 RepID=UPI000B358CE1|nr:solute:sodium symporter family transporter [Intestinibacillus massiliensis]
MLFTAVTFIGFTALVAVVAWWMTRGDDLSTQDGYFLAGRKLTGPVIAGSLMLTNLSTEQLIGQTGQSFATNMGPIAWEVTSCVALIMLALIFLPKYLKMGLTTVPEFLENRYDTTTKRIISFMFLLGYLLTYLPTVLYSGALVFNQIFEIDQRLGVSQLQGVVVTAVAIGIVGACYAIFGGLKAVAVSDTINGVGLIIGGFMIPIFGLLILGNDNIIHGINDLITTVPAFKFNAVNPADAVAPMIPWPVLFTGMVVNNLFYWCTNQSIIQRTFGAKNLKEAQKGAIFASFLKLVGPFFITICGIIAFRMSMDPNEGFFTAAQIENLTRTTDLAYPTLVLTVLPKPLLGFFAAVLFGAILSSFNSALNSSVTLYTLDIHRPMFNPGATDAHLVRVGKRFGVILATVSIIVAPFVSLAPSGLYDFLQSCFGFFNVPILAAVIVGLFNKHVPAVAPKVSLVMHVVLYSVSKLIPGLQNIHYLYVLAVLFALNVIVMLLIGKFNPRPEAYVMRDAGAVDLTPWKYAKPVACVSICLMLCVYFLFSPLGLAG